jgi:hypothetical protein
MSMSWWRELPMSKDSSLVECWLTSSDCWVPRVAHRPPLRSGRNARRGCLRLRPRLRHFRRIASLPFSCLLLSINPLFLPIHLHFSFYCARLLSVAAVAPYNSSISCSDFSTSLHLSKPSSITSVGSLSWSLKQTPRHPFLEQVNCHIPAINQLLPLRHSCPTKHSHHVWKTRYCS